VTVGLGTDANIQTDLFAEARSAEYLQRIQSLSMGCIPAARSLFRMLNLNGGKILGCPAGELKAGQEADLLVFNLSDTSLLPASDAADPETALINQLIFSAWPQNALTGVMVGGHWSVYQGELVRRPDSELQREIRRILRR
jgi:cytosine/adenosine deaminase-related metal-dependent hydrolase